MSARRIVIGLVGSVCAGKSAVAEALRKRGAVVYEADKLVHALYDREDVKKEVRALFGNGVFDAKGSVDRKKLGQLVFADERKVRELTGRVIFPRTGGIIKAEIERFRGDSSSGAPPALVLDAPTLFEAGRTGLCDRVLFVSAPRERREQWARDRRGWPPGELERRERHLMDERQKRAKSHECLENNGSLEELERRVGEIWDRWLGAVPGTEREKAPNR